MAQWGRASGGLPSGQGRRTTCLNAECWLDTLPRHSVGRPDPPSRLPSGGPRPGALCWARAACGVGRPLGMGLPSRPRPSLSPLVQGEDGFPGFKGDMGIKGDRVSVWGRGGRGTGPVRVCRRGWGFGATGQLLKTKVTPLATPGHSWPADCQLCTQRPWRPLPGINPLITGVYLGSPAPLRCVLNPQRRSVGATILDCSDSLSSGEGPGEDGDKSHGVQPGRPWAVTSGVAPWRPHIS